jgi:hypothetical protein
MIHGATHTRAAGFSLKSGHLRRVLQRTSDRSRTTAGDRLLLMVLIVLCPLQQYIGSISGFSFMFLIFSGLAGYLLLRSPSALARICTHPVFMTAYGWLLLCIVLESLQPNFSFREPFRIVQMVAGAVFVAALCRDRAALRSAMHGYLIAGVWMSIILVATVYGALKGATATDFAEAGKVRSMAFADNVLKADENYLAFVAAQGMVVALVLTLTTRSSRWRSIYLGILLVCGVALFLPMSRGSIMIAAIASGTVMLAYGVVRIKTIIIAMILGAGLLLWVPDAAFSRLTFSAETTHGKREARARLLMAAVDNLPEYIMTGVGAGNFSQSWGWATEFADRKDGRPRLNGAHNSLAQVTIYWGLVGLLPLIAIIYQAYRCLPRRCGTDPQSLCLLGIATSLLLLMMVTHVIAAKDFSLGLGLLVGAHYWIWPDGTARSATRQHGRLRPILRSQSPRDGGRRQLSGEITSS